MRLDRGLATGRCAAGAREEGSSGARGAAEVGDGEERRSRVENMVARPATGAEELGGGGRPRADAGRREAGRRAGPGGGGEEGRRGWRIWRTERRPGRRRGRRRLEEQLGEELGGGDWPERRGREEKGPTRPGMGGAGEGEGRLGSAGRRRSRRGGEEGGPWETHCCGVAGARGRRCGEEKKEGKEGKKKMVQGPDCKRKGPGCKVEGLVRKKTENG